MIIALCSLSTSRSCHRTYALVQAITGVQCMCLSEDTKPCWEGFLILNGGGFWRRKEASVYWKNTISTPIHLAATTNELAPLTCAHIDTDMLHQLCVPSGSTDTCRRLETEPVTSGSNPDVVDRGLGAKRTLNSDTSANSSNKRVYSPPPDGEQSSGKPGYIITHLNTPQPHYCSMAQLLDLSHTELELVSEFTRHTHPDVLRANAYIDMEWLGGGRLLSSSQALKQACLFLGQVHLALRKNPSNASLRPTVFQGYKQLSFKLQEQLLREFTNLLKWFKYESQSCDSALQRDDVLVTTAIFVYICGLAIGPQLLPFFTNTRQDLAGLCSTIQNTHFSFSRDTRPVVTFPVLPDNMRVKLPREDDLWAVVDYVMVDEGIPSFTEREHIHRVISHEIYAMAELFNVDVLYKSISHLSAWCVFHSDDFLALRQEENPYATIVISYYLAYCHLFHTFDWWRDRAQFDLYDVVEYLPEDYMKFVQWPLKVVENYQWTHEDLLSGKFAEAAENMKSFR